jgi:hypothetical protein
MGEFMGFCLFGMGEEKVFGGVFFWGMNWEK